MDGPMRFNVFRVDEFRLHTGSDGVPQNIEFLTRNHHKRSQTN